MIRKIRNFLNQGIFRDYYIGAFIDNKSDCKSFEVYYQNRVGCLMTASLLGMQIAAIKDGVCATNTAGETMVLKFSFEPPFEAESDYLKFQTDRESLLEFEEFIVNELKLKLKAKAKDVQYIEQAQVLLYNTLKNSAITNEFARKQVEYLFDNARSNLNDIRPQTESIDCDIVLSSAHRGVIEVEERLSTLTRSEDITFEELYKIQKNILKYQLSYSMKLRNLERNFLRCSNLNNDKTNPFWDYMSQMQEIESHPEMW